MKKTYPIREWIKLLKPDIRAKLLAGIQAQRGTRTTEWLDWELPSLHKAIDYAFTWNSTPEGHDFWSRLYDKAARDKRTPDGLRKDVDCTIPEDET